MLANDHHVVEPAHAGLIVRVEHILGVLYLLSKLFMQLHVASAPNPGRDQGCSMCAGYNSCVGETRAGGANRTSPGQAHGNCLRSIGTSWHRNAALETGVSLVKDCQPQSPDSMTQHTHASRYRLSNRVSSYCTITRSKWT